MFLAKPFTTSGMVTDRLLQSYACPHKAGQYDAAISQLRRYPKRKQAHPFTLTDLAPAGDQTTKHLSVATSFA